MVRKKNRRAKRRGVKKVGKKINKGKKKKVE